MSLALPLLMILTWADRADADALARLSPANLAGIEELSYQSK